jgi:hypothetical protein
MLDLIQPFLKDAGIAFVRCKLLVLLGFETTGMSSLTHFLPPPRRREHV